MGHQKAATARRKEVPSIGPRPRFRGREGPAAIGGQAVPLVAGQLGVLVVRAAHHHQHALLIQEGERRFHHPTRRHRRVARDDVRHRPLQIAILPAAVDHRRVRPRVAAAGIVELAVLRRKDLQGHQDVAVRRRDRGRTVIAQHEPVAAQLAAGDGVHGVEAGTVVNHLARRAAIDGIVDTVTAQAFQRIVGGQHGFHPEFEQALRFWIDVAGARVLAPGAIRALLAGLRFHRRRPRRAVVLRRAAEHRVDRVRPRPALLQRDHLEARRLGVVGDAHDGGALTGRLHEDGGLGGGGERGEEMAAKHPQQLTTLRRGGCSRRACACKWNR